MLSIWSKILSSVNGSRPNITGTLYQMTKFWPCPNRMHLQMTNQLLPKEMNFVLNKVKNGKKENAGYIFSVSQDVFKRPFPRRSVKSHDCGKRLRCMVFQNGECGETSGCEHLPSCCSSSLFVLDVYVNGE